MRYQQLLLIYTDQFVIAGRDPGYKVKELQKFLDYCFKVHGDVFDYSAVQGWLKIREKTNQEAGLSSIQNSISDFASWARLLDKTIGQIPKSGKVRRSRRKPVILNSKQVEKIICGQRASLSKSNIDARTFATITGLLFSTGMRVGEAIHMETSFVNLQDRSVYVPCGKSPRDRIVPISKSTCKVLEEYTKWRDGLRPNNHLFFIFEKEHIKKLYALYSRNFIQVTTKLGHRAPDSEGRNPENLRIHDLRHSFATNSLITIYNEGVDVKEAVVQLSSILGHKRVNETYWYIEAVPDLISAAFKRELS